MELLYFNSLEEIKPYWDKLDLGFYNPIIFNYDFYEESYAFLLSKDIPSRYEYKDPIILVGLEEEEVVGIIPLIRIDNSYEIISYAIGYSGSELMVKPEYLHLFLEQSKIPFSVSELNSNYLLRNKDYSKYYLWLPTNIVDLRNSKTIEDYLNTLVSKKRNDIKRTIKKNIGIEVKEELPNNYEKYRKLYDLKIWIKNRGFSIEKRLVGYDIIMKYAPRTQTLTFYNESKVVAITRCFIVNDTLYSLMCIRPSKYDNSIGIYSFYKRIENALLKGISFCDLSFEHTPENSRAEKIFRGKKKFTNQLSIFNAWGYTEGKINTHILPPYFDGKEWIF